MALKLVPGGSFDLDGQAARDSELELRQRLLAEPACRLRQSVPGPGEKGGHELIVETVKLAQNPAVATTGVIALTRIISLWLHRDRRRTVTITSTDVRSGDSLSITVTGEKIALSTLESALLQVTQQTGPPLPARAPQHRREPGDSDPRGDETPSRRAGGEPAA
jgi:hypothetical protein